MFIENGYIFCVSSAVHFQDRGLPIKKTEPFLALFLKKSFFLFFLFHHVQQLVSHF